MQNSHMTRTVFGLMVVAAFAGVTLAWTKTAPARPQQVGQISGAPSQVQNTELGSGRSANQIGRSKWRGINFHEHGVGLKTERVELPWGLNQPRRVQVLDLGPGLPGMQADILPSSAEISVNGFGPLLFEQLDEGLLEALVPAQWLSLWGRNEVEVRVWGPQGQQILKFSANVPGVL